jgi:hypothetical protein
MKREYDDRTGRPREDGHEVIEALSDDELEAEVTIAAVQPRRRAHRLDALLMERARRASLRPLSSA